MTDFFLATQAGQTSDNENVLKHHFTFSTYYEPTKFGRSTLRRADYITVFGDYTMSAHRDYVLVLYPLKDDMSVRFNNMDYLLKGNAVFGFVIPKGTHITLSSSAQSSVILCECDTHTQCDMIMPFDFTDKNGVNQIDILDIHANYSVNTESKPFFGLVLSGDLIINKTKLGFYDGFYTDNLLDIQGSAKILTFTMPVPL